jgi:hypothetical protein
MQSPLDASAAPLRLLSFATAPEASAKVRRIARKLQDLEANNPTAFALLVRLADSLHRDLVEALRRRGEAAS